MYRFVIKYTEIYEYTRYKYKPNSKTTNNNMYASCMLDIPAAQRRLRPFRRIIPVREKNELKHPSKFDENPVAVRQINHHYQIYRNT